MTRKAPDIRVRAAGATGSRGRRPARDGNPEIGVTFLCRRWRRTIPRAGTLCRASAQAALAGHAAAARRTELSIVLADDATVQTLNKRYRNKNKPTNVLAFPGQSRGVRSGRGGPPCALGDVVLAYETIQAEALAGGRPMAHHLCHLVVHGVLHLLGHDHQAARAARRMERLERDALANMGIPDPYDADCMVKAERRRV
jgi:probable rRNA maturation factor